MIRLTSTLQFETSELETPREQNEFKFVQAAFRVEVLLVLLFLFCSACAKPHSSTAANFVIESAGPTYAADENPSTLANDLKGEAESCGGLNFPKYIDTESQAYITHEIQSGSAKIILHFNVSCDGVDESTCVARGQQAITSYIDRTEGILEVGYRWPDWAAASFTVNPQALKQTIQDCQVKVIQADRREYPR